MKVKFTKKWSGPYGVFVKGRMCDLSGPMLAACPRDCIEEVKEEETQETIDATEAAKRLSVSLGMDSKTVISENARLENDSNWRIPVDEQQQTPVEKQPSKTKKRAGRHEKRE